MEKVKNEFIAKNEALCPKKCSGRLKKSMGNEKVLSNYFPNFSYQLELSR
jgi:hypothetical protein